MPGHPTDDDFLRLASTPAAVVPGPEPSHDEQRYDEVLSKSFELLVDRDAEYRRELESAPQLFLELIRHPPGRRKVLVQNLDRYRKWGLIEHLLQQTTRTWFEQPREGIGLAELALFIASRLDSTAYSTQLIHDLEARCWIHLANTQRILAELPSAEKSLTEADRLLQLGTDDPLERAGYLSAYGRLRIDQRRCLEAVRMLQRSVQLYKRLGDRHQAGCTLVTLAMAQTQLNEPARAIATLRHALDLIEVERDPRLQLFANHNLIDMLCADGRYLEARPLMARAKGLYERFASPVMRLHQLWLQGRIALGLGQNELAADTLHRAKEGFFELGKIEKAALVSLELALAQLKLGKRNEVAELAQEALETFRALDIPREILAALLVLAEAARDQRLSVALLGEIVRRAQAGSGAEAPAGES